MNINVLPDVLIEPFSVTTIVSDFVIARKVFRGCPISLSNNVKLVDSLQVYMLYFDVKLVFDCFHACFASIYCRTTVVKL